MKRNETATQSVNLFPLLALSALTLLGVIAGLVMLFGLHNKIQKPAVVESVISADDIGQIELDQNLVRINLMTKGTGDRLQKSQQIEIPLTQFINSGYPRLKTFMDQMVEEGVIVPQTE